MSGKVDMNINNKKKTLVAVTSFTRWIQFAFLIRYTLFFHLEAHIRLWNAYGASFNNDVFLLKLDLAICKERVKKNEQDIKKWYESSAIVPRALLDKYFGD